MRHVKLFIPYSHKDARAALDFRRRIEPLLSTARDMRIELLQDVVLLPGEKWAARIEEALTQSDGGIPLVSPNFLNSAYIRHVELKHLLESKKILLPVHLSRVCFERTDLRELAAYQVFGLGFPGECHPFTRSHREDFAFAAFQKIYDRLAKELSHA